tara:strand:+ start:5402 stop:5644 length:243 start_codon:yes stop_codon:yes gene_type:complete
MWKKYLGKNIMEVEKLDLTNVIEVSEIRKKLIHHPDLLSMFELLIIVCNKRLNSDIVCNNYEVEESEDEPNLSDHDSDEN